MVQKEPSFETPETPQEKEHIYLELEVAKDRGLLSRIKGAYAVLTRRALAVSLPVPVRKDRQWLANQEALISLSRNIVN
jgi:hypothetical protein